MYYIVSYEYQYYVKLDDELSETERLDALNDIAAAPVPYFTPPIEQQTYLRGHACSWQNGDGFDPEADFQPDEVDEERIVDEDETDTPAEQTETDEQES